MKLFFARADDHVALYVDGKLKDNCEEYEMQAWDLGHRLGLPFTVESIESKQMDFDWFCENARNLPQDLADVKFEKDNDEQQD